MNIQYTLTRHNTKNIDLKHIYPFTFYEHSTYYHQAEIQSQWNKVYVYGFHYYYAEWVKNCEMYVNVF